MIKLLVLGLFVTVFHAEAAFAQDVDRIGQDLLRVGGIAPFADTDPLLRFQIFVMLEEVLDLLKHDRRQVMPLPDIRIIREGRVDGHADELFVAAVLVFEVEDADRP